jgi:hypothetical protein
MVSSPSATPTVIAGRFISGKGGGGPSEVDKCNSTDPMNDTPCHRRGGCIVAAQALLSVIDLLRISLRQAARQWFRFLDVESESREPDVAIRVAQIAGLRSLGLGRLFSRWRIPQSDLSSQEIAGRHRGRDSEYHHDQ